MKVIWDGDIITTISKKIRLGDIMIIEENERAMADVVLLSFISS